MCETRESDLLYRFMLDVHLVAMFRFIQKFATSIFCRLYDVMASRKIKRRVQSEGDIEPPISRLIATGHRITLPWIWGFMYAFSWRNF